ncbi:MAG: hypothetical protein COV70_01500 [Parcubacteria group bacterium CG11_big_fil_rev_8_21_14_0_20_39_22]|nr:MAG: hypothetical protein COV70_01500 [Parcubacteria group bacterium CG11_big_fil_rev_8_21_14_0_20_39_22]
MEQKGITFEGSKLRTPQAELDFLREEVRKRESLIEEDSDKSVTESVISDALRDYRFNDPNKILETEYELSHNETEAIVLDLSPEPHDQKIEELAGMLQIHGIRNVLSVLEKTNEPHLEDDFHRFLVQYVKSGYKADGLNERSPIFKPLHMTLFEIALPEPEEDKSNQKKITELLSGMEQLYSGMMSIGRDDKESYFTIEIANANGSDEFIFYASVPDGAKEIFEKQVISIFHNARISEAKDDYNIFNPGGETVAVSASFTRNAIFPIKDHNEFESDPLSVILNSFSKIDRDGEGAAIQFVISPWRSEAYHDKYDEAIKALEKGKSLKDALDFSFSIVGEIGKGFKEIFKSDNKSKNKEEIGSNSEKEHIDERSIEEIKKKTSSSILSCNIRVVASGPDKKSAEEIISPIEASFNQFKNENGNGFVFKRVPNRKVKSLLRDFSWRIFKKDEVLPLSIRELSTIIHFPVVPLKSSPELRKSKAGTAAAPIDVPKEGTILGTNVYRGTKVPVAISDDDRLRHMYVIGQTGTGKTTLLKNMIVQDMIAGNGLCMIDPHGADIQDVLSAVPEGREKDVIYFDPSFIDRPFGLNMLEYDERFPEQKTFVVNEMLSIFDKLFDMKSTGGPMFEQYFRNAVLLTIEDKEGGSTLLDVSRVLSDSTFREMKLSRCRNPVVVQFWREVAGKAGGEAALQNIVPYITSKFDNFLSNDIMRPIVAQESSSFDLRDVMDNKKILLVNLAKGRLGDLNSNLIGLIVVGKMLMAALSRVDSLGDGDLPPFYLYIDEFQNITTPSISAILSEARKYKLSLCVAHQFIAQLDEKISDAVFGNVGTIASFRVGSEDAEFLEKQFEPVFSARDIVNLSNRNAYLRLLSNGEPMRPFNIETNPPVQGDKSKMIRIKEMSYQNYGRDKALVEADILKKYNFQ